MGVNPIEKEIAELFMNFYESFDVMSWLKQTDFTSFLCDWCTGTDRNGRPWMAHGRRRIVGLNGWKVGQLMRRFFMAN